MSNGLGKKEAYVMAQYETILKYEGSDAANRYLGKYGVDIQVGSYKDLRKQKGKSNRQVHHLNQDAAFRSKIKKKDGLSINLEGDRKSTRLNSSHPCRSRMPSSA